MLAGSHAPTILDASGDPGWPQPHGKSSTEWYVLGGLSFEEQLWDQANASVEQVLSRYFPSQRLGKELRYTRLHAGAPPYDQLTQAQRKQLADDVFNLVLNLKPVLFAVAINKSQHKNRYADRTILPDVLALRFIAPRFHKYLERIKGRGIFVMDEEERQREKRMRQLIAESKEYGIMLKSPLRPFLIDTRLPRIVEGIMFVSSKDSPAMQLADFCTHSVWLHFEEGKTSRFKGETYGLKTWP